MRTVGSPSSATPTFIGLTQVSRVNTNGGNHLHISNGVLLLVNISHMLIIPEPNVCILEVGIAKICDTVYSEDSSSRYT